MFKSYQLCSCPYSAVLWIWDLAHSACCTQHVVTICLLSTHSDDRLTTDSDLVKLQTTKSTGKRKSPCVEHQANVMNVFSCKIQYSPQSHLRFWRNVAQILHSFLTLIYFLLTAVCECICLRSVCICNSVGHLFSYIPWGLGCVRVRSSASAL